jgi:hypothetical protein
MFRKLDLFPSSGERRQTPTLLRILERTNLKTETDPVSAHGLIRTSSKNRGLVMIEEEEVLVVGTYFRVVILLHCLYLRKYKERYTQDQLFL